VANYHCSAIDDQLRYVVQAAANGQDSLQAVQSYTELASARMAPERNSLRQEVMERLNELTIIQDELSSSQALSPEEREEIKERIRMDCEICEAELHLLQLDAPLRELPVGALNALLQAHEVCFRDQSLTDVSWPQGFSPMHWAAQQARRDIVEYLIRQKGGRDLLNMRDNEGYIPRFYADAARRPEFVQYLVEAGSTLPMHPQERRPALNNLPSQYMPVLKQIEDHGWLSMNWKDGYTMLHWAAEKDNADLCQYLISLKADPNARDGKDRIPLDCAVSHGANLAQAVLQGQKIEMNLERGLSLSTRQSRVMNPRESMDVPATFMSFLDAMSASSDTLHSQVSEKAANAIPDTYLKVIEDIDTQGWQQMSWARGYTLLHWAAKNDMPDLCARFMWQKADPEHRDDGGRSALDYAREAQSRSAEMQLNRGAPAMEPKIPLMRPKGNRASVRGSMIVDGRVRPWGEESLSEIRES